MGQWCDVCHRYYDGSPVPPWYVRAVKQVVTWVGWGAIGGGTWVLVGELLKKYIVKA